MDNGGLFVMMASSVLKQMLPVGALDSLAHLTMVPSQQTIGEYELCSWIDMWTSQYYTFHVLIEPYAIHYDINYYCKG